MYRCLHWLLFDLLAQKQAPSAFQTLLIPLVVDLDPVESQAADAYTAELAGLGFLFDWVGLENFRKIFDFLLIHAFCINQIDFIIW